MCKEHYQMKTTCYKRGQKVQKTAVVDTFSHICEDFFDFDSYGQIISIEDLYYEVRTFGGTSRKSTS